MIVTQGPALYKKKPFYSDLRASPTASPSCSKRGEANPIGWDGGMANGLRVIRKHKHL